jgi:hypothetical protein
VDLIHDGHRELAAPGALERVQRHITEMMRQIDLR